MPIILVPSTLLLEQWASQVRELLGARVMLAGGGHDGWSSGGVLRAVVESSRPDRPYVVDSRPQQRGQPELPVAATSGRGSLLA